MRYVNPIHIEQSKIFRFQFLDLKSDNSTENLCNNHEISIIMLCLIIKNNQVPFCRSSKSRAHFGAFLPVSSLGIPVNLLKYVYILSFPGF